MHTLPPSPVETQSSFLISINTFNTIARNKNCSARTMPLSVLDVVVTSIGLPLSAFLYYTTIHVPKGLRLPPGPARHPIWGNLRDFPTGTLEYKVYERWARKYVDSPHNSAELEYELFNKRGMIYSGRPRTTMLHDLTHVGESNVVTMDYDEQWTQHRAMLHDVLSSKILLSYRPILEANARSFAHRLIAQPVNDLKFARDLFGGFIMQFAYGMDVLPENDPYVTLAERFISIFSQVLVPGAYLVDNVPILKYLPFWFPGLKFPKAAGELNKSFQDMLNIPYEYVKTAFMKGNYKPSFVSSCLEDLANESKSSDDVEEAIRQVAVAIYMAGIDSLDTQIRLFFLAMALYPDVQKKAQEELDRVVGRDSLPLFADLSNLPYVNALCSESIRWHPVAPMALPHQLKTDDVINGYFIPKGTICFGNTWFLLHSENDYGPDTDKFRPERFLDGSAKLKPDAAFGYGRRICPGKPLAEAFLGITIATILHVANISILEGEPLSVILENDEFSPGVVKRPRDFRCRIDAQSGSQNLLNQLIPS